MRDQIYSVGDLRAIIAPIAARHGVERIYLFGSYARGEATKNSDVDLRVDKGNLRGMFALGALYSDLRRQPWKRFGFADNRQSGSTVSGSNCRGGNCFI